MRIEKRVKNKIISKTSPKSNSTEITIKDPTNTMIIDQRHKDLMLKEAIKIGII